MKYFISLSLLCFASVYSIESEEIKDFSINQIKVNECYYYETEDHQAEWYYKGKMDAYDEIVQLINRMNKMIKKEKDVV